MTAPPFVLLIHAPRFCRDVAGLFLYLLLPVPELTLFFSSRLYLRDDRIIASIMTLPAGSRQPVNVIVVRGGFASATYGAAPWLRHLYLARFLAARRFIAPR